MKRALERSTASRITLGIAVVLATAMAVNGVVMLMIPFAWYKAVPGVTETGPFNQHLVRDIALLYTLIGAAFLTGVLKPDWRVACWGTPAAWLTGHAVFHLWEIAEGICGSAAFSRDFPAVTLPALLGLILTGWAWRTRSLKVPSAPSDRHAFAHG